MAYTTPPSVTRTTLPRELHDFIVEMAIAVHKRSIYPATHPILHGAIEAVQAKASNLLGASGEVSIGIADRQLIVDGHASGEDHPLLSEFAARLADHQIGAVRLQSGVTVEEFERFIASIARPADEDDIPLGRQSDASSTHVVVHPIVFERLGLLEGDAMGPTNAYQDATWRALVNLAMSGDFATGDTVDPRLVASAIGDGRDDAGFDAAVIEKLAALLDELGTRGPSAPMAQRARASDLVTAIGEAGLNRLLEVGGRMQSVRVVRTANDTLAARAVVDLVRAASSNEAVSISGAMLRLLQKLSANAQAPGGKGAEAERVLRHSVRRLLDGWTLENPNPELYERVLEDASVPSPKRVTDLRRDVAEPERILDIAIETSTLVPGVEVALSRLALRDGLAAVLERLRDYPESPVRESLVDRLLNEASLREYLAQPSLDMALLRHAVDRMKSRAIEPLLSALERRGDADAVALGELLARMGWDVLEPLGAAMPDAGPSLLRRLLPVFDRLDAWPPQTDPMHYAAHPDAAIRRESIKFLLRSDTTRDAAIALAVRDRETRIFSLGLSALAKTCPPAVARALMGRYEESGLTPDLRTRIIRAVALSRNVEAEHWLGNLLVTKRWWLGSLRLRKATPETLAAAAAVVTYMGGSTLAQQVKALAAQSRGDYQRAIARGDRMGANA